MSILLLSHLITLWTWTKNCHHVTTCLYKGVTGIFALHSYRPNYDTKTHLLQLRDIINHHLSDNQPLEKGTKHHRRHMQIFSQCDSYLRRSDVHVQRTASGSSSRWLHCCRAFPRAGSMSQSQEPAQVPDCTVSSPGATCCHPLVSVVRFLWSISQCYLPTPGKTINYS